MKDLREIRITRPRLIKIRNNYRELWKMVVEERLSEYHNKMAEYETASEAWSKLRKKRTQLAKKRNYSIIFCGICGQRTGDRIWVASRRKWYCLNCYYSYLQRQLIREKLKRNEDRSTKFDYFTSV
jgi:transcription elongation factor Elf1